VSRIWFISDPHFFHAKVSVDVRGVSIEENNAFICEAWRKTVKPNDRVYVLGDISVSKHTESLALISELPGEKHLIPGNHDPVHPMHRTSQKVFREWLNVFETISPYCRKKLHGQYVLMCHFPYTEERYIQYALKDCGLPLLHGHTHSTVQIRGRAINMCWEAWGRMVSQDEIIEIVKTLEE